MILFIYIKIRLNLLRFYDYQSINDMRKGEKMSEKNRLELAERMLGNTLSKGRKLTFEQIEKIRKHNLGKKHKISKEGRERMRIKNYSVWNKDKGKLFSYICNTCNNPFNASQKNRKYCSISCFRIANKGERNYRWIKDRTKIKDYWTDRNNPEYKQWRRKIWERDNYKCRINNQDCSGKIIVHHILGYTKYPELRFVIDNGITLCHFHHPRKKSEEIRLVPFFRELIDNHKM